MKYIKIISFVLVFTLIFLSFQRIYHERWNEEYTQRVDFEKTDLSYDVVFMGTSELRDGVNPCAMYDETGLICYNMAYPRKSAMTFYYDLENIIETNKPRIVAMDFSALFSGVEVESHEHIYRERVYALHGTKYEKKLLKKIIQDNPLEAVSYVFPLLRFHSMWSLEQANFSPEYMYDTIEPDYHLGWNVYASLRDEDYPKEDYVVTEDMWEYDEDDESLRFEPEEDAIYWYDKMMELCRNNGVNVIGVLSPKLGEAKEIAAEFPAISEYLEDKGVECFNYNNYDSVVRMQLDWQEEYWDPWHLNYIGSDKWSRYLARDIQMRMGLPDHRTESSEDKLLMDTFLSEYRRNGYGK